MVIGQNNQNNWRRINRIALALALITFSVNACEVKQILCWLYQNHI